MKTKLSFLLLLMTQFIISQSSTVTVFSEEGERFYVIVNGVRQNDAPGTNVVVTDLEKPNYLFKVIFEDQKIPTINKNIYLEAVDGRANATFVLRKNRKGKMEMRMSSFDYDVDKKPAKNTQVVKYHTEENPIETAPVLTDTTEKVDINSDMMGINMNTKVEASDKNMNMNVNIGGMSTDVSVNTTVTTTQTTTRSTQPNNVQIKNNVKTEEVVGFDEVTTKPTTKSCKTAMAAASFQAAKNSINKQTFADTKMKTAKQILNANCMSVSQIVEIMNLFSFEENKLDFAKTAYAKCTNKGEYFMVNDAFTFSTSTDELTEYIESLEE
uniref:DUF4476 domain-containing protein n=3 Tax=Flavobacterium sp. TaxID=239 RepID=UPI00404A4E8B